MTQPVTVRVDLKPFNDSLDALAKGLNKSVTELLPYHAASVWKTAMNRTRTLTTKSIERAAKVRALNDIGLSSKQTRGQSAATSINMGIRADYGRVFLQVRPPNGKRRFIKTHDPAFGKNLVSSRSGKPVKLPTQYEKAVDADVGEFKSGYRERLATAKNTTHFGKQSFLSALQDLHRLTGIDWTKITPLNVPGLAKIMKATDRKGRSHRNGYAAIRVRDPKRMTIEMENHFPSDAAKAEQSINSAIITVDARIKRETKVGLFNNLSEVVKRYPFLKIT